MFCGILYTPSNNTCVPAHPVPHRDKAKCQPYHRTTNGYCSKIIGSRLVYGSITNQKEKEQRLKDFVAAKVALQTMIGFHIPNTCLNAVDLIYCNHYFPDCDNTSAIFLPRLICRETCELLIKRYCKREWLKAQEFNKVLSASSFGEQVKRFYLLNCTKLPKRDGGKIPECFYPRELLEGIVKNLFPTKANI